MSVTSRLMKPGSFSLRFKKDCPRSVYSKPDFFDHIVITPTRLQPIAEFSDANILSSAIYTGVIHTHDDPLTLVGAGLEYWLGTPDGVSPSFSGYGTTPAVTLSTAFTAHPGILDTVTTITAGTLNNTGLPTIGDFGIPAFITPREATDAACKLFGAEWRINPNATLDTGLASNLFVTSPTVVVTRLVEGQEGSFRGLAGTNINAASDVQQYTTVVGAVTNTPGGPTFSSAGSTPYVDFFNNAVAMYRFVDAAGATDTQAATLANSVRADLNQVRRNLSLSSSTYSVGRFVEPGDYVYAWDQDAGLVDPAIQIPYRGDLISPVLLRVYALTWPIQQGMGVYLRESGATPVYTDLSDQIEWEQGDVTWEVGATARDLDTTSNYGSPAYLGDNPSIAARPAAITLGRVGSQGTATAQNGVTTAITLVSNIAVTFTADGSRRYKITGHVNCRQRTAAGAVTVEIFESTASTIVHSVFQSIGLDNYAAMHIFYEHTPASGSRTYRLRVKTSNNTVDLNGVGNAFILVEDIGDA